jgi:hypothetical protein
VATRREDYQLALLGPFTGGVLNGDEVGHEDQVTPDRHRPEDLVDLADACGNLVGRARSAEKRPPGLGAAEREPGGIEAAAHWTGRHVRDRNFPCAEDLADLPRLLAACLGQVALGRASSSRNPGGSLSVGRVRRPDKGPGLTEHAVSALASDRGFSCRPPSTARTNRRVKPIFCRAPAFEFDFPGLERLGEIAPFFAKTVANLGWY